MPESTKVHSRKPAPATPLRRNALPLVGALIGGVAAAVAAIFLVRRNADAPAAGHPAPDLERNVHPGPLDRADPHFRPNMDAPMTADDRAALAPALARPTLVDG